MASFAATRGTYVAKKIANKTKETLNYFFMNKFAIKCQRKSQIVLIRIPKEVKYSKGKVKKVVH